LTGYQTALPADQVIAGFLNDVRRVFLHEGSLENYQIVGATVASQTIEARFCFVARYSIHDQPSSDLIDSLQVPAGGLDEWMRRGGIRSEVISRQSGGTSIAISYEERKRAFAIPDGELMVTTRTSDPTALGFTAPSSEISFKQETWIQLKIEHRRTLEEWRRLYLGIEEVLALVMGSYFDLDWPYVTSRHGEEHDWFTFYFRRDASLRSFEPAIHSALLMWAWVEDSLGALVSGWMNCKAQHPTACSHFMTTLLRQDFHLEHRFITLMWSLEVLHRGLCPSPPKSLDETTAEVLVALSGQLNSEKREWVRRKLLRPEEISLEGRIHQLLERVPMPATAESVRRFAMQCAEYRNQLSHFGGPKSHPAPENYYDKLIGLTQAVQVLLNLILLSVSGVSAGTLSRAFSDTPYAKTRLLRILKHAGLDLDAD
jgi:hypothetical protein